MQTRIAGLVASSFFGMLMGFAVGCSASEVSCADVCSCQEKAGQACESECATSHGEQKSSATKAGCAAEYAELQTCLADNAICDHKRKDLVVPVSACGKPAEKLLGCEFPPVTTGVTSGAGVGGGPTTGSSM